MSNFVKTGASMPRSTWRFRNRYLAQSGPRFARTRALFGFGGAISNHDNTLPDLWSVAAGVQSIGELCSSALTLELLTYRPCVVRSNCSPSHLTHSCYIFASWAAQQFSRLTAR